MVKSPLQLVGDSTDFWAIFAYELWGTSFHHSHNDELGEQ